MEADCHYLSYQQTHSFSKLAVDYANQAEQLKAFYQHSVSLEGIRDSINARKQFPQQRSLLVQELKKQYEALVLSDKQAQNIEALLSDNTFTITTAHQPNIFTGPLYFIYKILHAIKLADELKQQMPEFHFVPVYYMGSEDADLDELGHIYLGGEKLSWETNQVGAVGRMSIKGLDAIIRRLEGEFGNLPYGKQMVDLIKKAYSGKINVQQATFQLVNELFKELGLIVLIPDNANLKRAFQPVVEKELLEGFSYPLVQQTIEGISQHYKVQAGGREINLFYLNDEGRRERIELLGGKYEVTELGLSFSKEEVLAELAAHPERFSANVILRGVFQETILPNIAFVGGGGELAYWLELKKVFEAVGVPYPMLILRNSFLLLEPKAQDLQKKLNLSLEELFWGEQALSKKIVAEKSANKLDTKAEQEKLYELYEALQVAANSINVTLKPHIAALHVQSLKGLKSLEKKMLRAEKRHHKEALTHIAQLRRLLFPANGLQERVDNFMPYYAKYGPALIQLLYNNSLGIEQQFVILNLHKTVQG